MQLRPLERNNFDTCAGSLRLVQRPVGKYYSTGPTLPERNALTGGLRATRRKPHARIFRREFV
jgi:hypothetical protein